MISPFYFFDKIYVINLKDRIDRLRTFYDTVNPYELNLEIQEGIIYSGYTDKKRNACVGNHLAHAECIKKAKKEKANNVLIFEDDLEFFKSKSETEELLSYAIKELPKDWALFYLGINMDRYLAHRYSLHLAKLDGGFSTHAYAINSHMFDRLIEINENVEMQHNDVYYSENIMNHYPCFVTNPLLAGQRTGYSDIMMQIMNSSEMMKERFKRNLK